MPTTARVEFGGQFDFVPVSADPCFDNLGLLLKQVTVSNDKTGQFAHFQCTQAIVDSKQLGWIHRHGGQSVLGIQAAANGHAHGLEKSGFVVKTVTRQGNRHTGGDQAGWVFWSQIPMHESLQRGVHCRLG